MWKKLLVALLPMLLLSGCVAPPERLDYAQFRSADPHSILVVPVVNRSTEVDAPDYFLSTISQPLAERGYYVFPVNLTKRVMEEEGMSDADMVHANNPVVLAQLFGADSVMYISIESWDSKYILLSTTTTVALNYSLKSGTTGETLWKGSRTLAYSPQANNAGGGLASLIAMAITAAIEKAAPSYIPLAKQANLMAVMTNGIGLPAGPHDDQYKKDTTNF